MIAQKAAFVEGSQFNDNVEIAGSEAVGRVFTARLASYAGMGRRGDENGRRGMIVSFQSGDQELTTHRIVGIMDGNYLQTKGDANEEPDANLVPLDRVKKAFILRIPYLGYVGHFIRTPLGWLLFVITPASLIIYGEIKNIVAALRPADHPVGGKTG